MNWHEMPNLRYQICRYIWLWIDDLPKAVQWRTAQGVRFTTDGIRKGAARGGGGTGRGGGHWARAVCLKAQVRAPVAAVPGIGPAATRWTRHPCWVSEKVPLWSFCLGT